VRGHKALLNRGRKSDRVPSRASISGGIEIWDLAREIDKGSSVGGTAIDKTAPRYVDSAVTDLQEEPAVPPQDPKGSLRIGWAIAGSLLIFFGWGIGVLTNLILHRLAPVGGLVIGSIRIYPSLGTYAWIVLGVGATAGVLGVALLWFRRTLPVGPAVLPGYPY